MAGQQQKPGFIGLSPAQQQALNNQHAPQQHTPAAAPKAPSGRTGGWLNNKWVKYSLIGIAGLATLPFWAVPAATAGVGYLAYKNWDTIKNGALFVPRAIKSTLAAVYHHTIPTLWKVAGIFAFGVAVHAGMNTSIDIDNQRGDGFWSTLGNNALSSIKGANGLLADTGRVALPLGGKVLNGGKSLASSTSDTVGECVDSSEKCVNNAADTAGNIVDSAADTAGNLAVAGGNKYLEAWGDFINWYYKPVNEFGERAWDALPSLPRLADDGNVTEAGNKTRPGETVTPRHKPEQARPVLSQPAQARESAETPAPAENVNRAAPTIREQLLARGSDFLNSRWVVACVPKIMDDRGFYLPGAAEDIERGIIAQRLAAADTAVNAQMNDPNSPLVRAITANKVNNIRLTFANGTLRVDSQKSSTFHNSPNYDCSRTPYSLEDFLEGSGMNPGKKTVVIPPSGPAKY